ncbi:hypothetical protein BJ546DRAFT_1058201 [Cryomyces antarcticus]
MSRSRAATTPQAVATSAVASAPPLPATTSAEPTSQDRDQEEADGRAAGAPLAVLPSIRFIPHQEPRATRPSLQFPSISRTLPAEGSIIRVGRYSERDGQQEAPPNIPSSAPVGFKSKVVSRRHCEFWCSNSQWYIKDVKSSSGTFLNHIRLSQPGAESKPWPVNDGDVVQLGIDFRGGEEMIFRCVKIRIECNRGWQKGLNNFNKSTHKRLRNLAKAGSSKDADAASNHSSECSICLMSVAPCQSLFVAPCSHVWHYKCIRPILNGATWPHFLCPNCRAMTDLEAEVDEPEEYEEWEDDEDLDIQSTSVNPDIGVNGGSSTQGHDDRPSTPNGVHGSSDGAVAHLNSTMGGISLPDSQADGETSSLSSAEPFTTTSASAASSAAINILSAQNPAQTGLFNGTADTPMTPAQIALAPDLMIAEGPMTPRNDAGPFIFDGSAGRSEGRVAGALSMVQSIDHAAVRGST